MERFEIYELELELELVERCLSYQLYIHHRRRKKLNQTCPVLYICHHLSELSSADHQNMNSATHRRQSGTPPSRPPPDPPRRRHSSAATWRRGVTDPGRAPSSVRAAAATCQRVSVRTCRESCHVTDDRAGYCGHYSIDRGVWEKLAELLGRADTTGVDIYGHGGFQAAY